VLTSHLPFFHSAVGVSQVCPQPPGLTPSLSRWAGIPSSATWLPPRSRCPEFFHSPAFSEFPPSNLYPHGSGSGLGPVPTSGRTHCIGLVSDTPLRSFFTACRLSRLAFSCENLTQLRFAHGHPARSRLIRRGSGVCGLTLPRSLSPVWPARPSNVPLSGLPLQTLAQSSLAAAPGCPGRSFPSRVPFLTGEPSSAFPPEAVEGT
jgi:hypothetical protein